MAVINFAHRELSAKLVYFGATGAGCNTNVRQLHALVPSNEISEVHEFGPSDSLEQSRYFEFIAKEGSFDQFTTRFRVYSLPGGIQHPEHRREVLDGVDAIVFVSDAREGRGQANLDSLLELDRLLTNAGRLLDRIPSVIQVNHFDAENGREADRVTFDLNHYGFPVVTASARSGEGVVETHGAIIEQMITLVKRTLSGEETGLKLAARHNKVRDHASFVVANHLERIDETGTHKVPTRDSEYRALPPGPVVRVPYLPDDFIGTRPVRVLGTRVDDDAVLVDLVMVRLTGDDPRRLTLSLANSPVDTAPIPMITTAQKVSPQDSHTTATHALADKYDLPPRRADFPPVWYGVAGVAGGILIGLLLGALLLT